MRTNNPSILASALVGTASLLLALGCGGTGGAANGDSPGSGSHGGGGTDAGRGKGADGSTLGASDSSGPSPGDDEVTGGSEAGRGPGEAGPPAAGGDASTPPSGPQTGMHVPMDDLEVFNPFPSWANAKTMYGAKGDGVTDDAPALQKALSDLGQVGKAGTLYLPAGTYKLGSTLSYLAPENTPNHGTLGVSIVGDAPTTTILKWAGPSGGAMINQNGGYNVSYSRLTLDGQKTAGFGILQAWNSISGTANYTSSAGDSSEHVDLIFQDMYIGIMAGEGASQKPTQYNQLDSEGQIRRVTFLRMGYAGLNTGGANALDWWIFDSQFIDCARGVSNLFDGTGTPTEDEGASNGGSNLGGGGFYVYRSYFSKSTVADVNICNPGAWLSMHENVSIGSNQFFTSCGAQAHAGDETIFEKNRIIDTTNPTSIANGNMGALILIDNQIRSATSIGPVVVMDPGTDANGPDLISINNQYTVPAANYFKKAGANDRVLSMSDTTVAAGSIDVTPPTMPPTPARVTRQVIEVAASATGAEIQTAINQAVTAAKGGAVNPIVHLPPGTYEISTALTIPAQTRIQVVGDASRSALYWSGGNTGSFFELDGPSYATIRNLYMYGPGGSVNAVSITKADQLGGRIFFEGSLPGKLTAQDLTMTQLLGQENTGFADLIFTNVDNFAAVGTGGISTVTTTDSNLVIMDNWNEGTASQLYRMTGGVSTLMGAQLCPATHSPPIEPIVPAFEFDNFSGSSSLIGIALVLNEEPGGIGYEIGAENSKTNLMILGSGANVPTFFKRTASGGNVGLIESRNSTGNGSTQQPNVGLQTPAFIDSMLTQVRALTWDTAPYSAPAGATDVRIYRVNAADTQGVVITGN